MDMIVSLVMSCDILLPSMSRGCPHVALVEQGCPDAPQQTGCEFGCEFDRSSLGSRVGIHTHTHFTCAMSFWRVDEFAPEAAIHMHYESRKRIDECSLMSRDVVSWASAS